MQLTSLMALVAVVCLVCASLILQPPRGDEPDIYLPVINASADAWPSLNTKEVAYGISPIWTWSTGAIASLGATDLMAGRLLSFLSWVGCILLCIRRKFSIDLRLATLLVHPVLVVYAARAHPLWPGILLLLLATRDGIPSSIRVVLTTAAIGLQNFLLAAAGVLGLLLGKTYIERARWFIVLSGAGLIAILLTWALYGGQYPEAFKASPYYEPYKTFSGMTLGYIPLTLGLGGWMAALLITSRIRTQHAIAAVLGAVVAILLLRDPAPNGPLFNHASSLGQVGTSIAAVIIGAGLAGWIGLSRGRWQIISGAILATASIATLPFFYERYSWFAVIPVLAIWAAREPFNNIPQKALVFWLVFSPALSAVFLWRGSL